MSKALSLKYRPSRFSDLIGQDSVSQTLSLALDLDKVSHAYLFSGLRGSGKTSSARIFARALQCEKYPTSNPCGECYSCKSALNNSHIDIIEMDAASSRSIDDIKNLIEQIQYRPSFGRFKIFIIDEIHMLTKEAFNALLKTLEEPPEYVKFILATTDPLKLPATILSRTQHFRFKKIPLKSISMHLQRILQLEGVEFEDGAIDLLSRNCGGSLRDAITMLEQAIIFCKNNITITSLSEMLGALNPTMIEDFFLSILSGDNKKTDEILLEFEAYEVENVIDEMILFIKERLLSKDPKYSIVVIDRFFKILSEAKQLLSINSEASFVLLLATMKFRESLNIQEIDKLISKIEQEILHDLSVNSKTLESPPMVDSTSIQPRMQVDIKNQISENMITNSTQSYKANTNVDEVTIIRDEVGDDKNGNEVVIKLKTPFERMIVKIFDIDYELGEIFANNISFVSFKDNVLVWQSNANDENRKILRESYGVILKVAREIFGENLIIKPATQSPQNNQSKNETTQQVNLDKTMPGIIDNIKNIFSITEIKKEEAK